MLSARQPQIIMLPALLNFAACQIALRLIGLAGWLRVKGQGPKQKKRGTKESSIKFLKSCSLRVAVSGLSQLQVAEGERLQAQSDYSLTTTAIGIDSSRKLK